MSNVIENLVKSLEDIAPLSQSVAELEKMTINEETEALNSIIEKAKPILGIVAHRIISSYSDPGGQFSTAHEMHFKNKGLILVDNFGRENIDKDTRGSFIGSRLVLFQDGTLSYLERVGEWSRWQDEGSNWYIDNNVELTPEQVIKRYTLATVLSGFAEEIVSGLEKLKSQIEEDQERLENVAKIKEVLKACN